MIGAEEALAMEGGDTALIVAIVDSGVALGHPEFTERLRPGVDTVDLPGEQVSRGLKLYGDYHGPRSAAAWTRWDTARRARASSARAAAPCRRGLAAARGSCSVRALAGATLSESARCRRPSAGFRTSISR